MRYPPLLAIVSYFFLSTVSVAHGADFPNPLATDSIAELLMALLRIFMIVAIPIVVFFIIYAGFMYATARGNTEQIKTATRALMYAIIGGLLVIGAIAITEIVANLVAAFQ